MRRVDRITIAVPASLDGPGSPAARERTRAAQHFQVTPALAFTFRAYKRDDVAGALNALFHGKCAYCESSIQAVQPTDVEHFRPKGRVAECPGHPGYWWLAGSWDNLLASCIDCNRRRYQDAHQLAHDPLGDEVGGQFYLGKGDLFPILGPNYAQAEADDLEAEDAALIDPTRRDPNDHLTWLEEQGLSLIGPRVEGQALDPYGRHTYRVFGLNRQGLVEARTMRQLEIRAQLVLIENRINKAIEIPEPYSSELRHVAFEEFQSLYRYAEPDQPYSAMVKALLDGETSRLLAKYEGLAP